MAGGKKAISAQQALEWAFGREFARIEPLSEREREPEGHGMEYVILQRALLGGGVDISRGRSYPHDDADYIASVLTALPENLGGRTMAYWMAQLARVGAQPDWLPDVQPRMQPVEWAGGNQNGRLAKSEKIGIYVEEVVTRHPKNPQKLVKRYFRREIRYTPCTWEPCTPDDLKRARNWYLKWWTALDEIRMTMDGHKFAHFTLNRVMPPKRPWATASTLGVRVAGSPR